MFIFRFGCDSHFNPRSHERSDEDDIIIESLAADFNPRSHERSDPVSGFSLVS